MARLMLLVSACVLILLLALQPEVLSAQVTPQADIYCNRCLNDWEPGQGPIHEFNGAGSSYFYCPCHYFEWLPGYCQTYHDYCGLAMGERETDLLEVIGRLASAGRDRQVQVLRRLLFDNANVAYYAAERGAVQILSCDGRMVVANIPVTPAVAVQVLAGS